MADLPSYPDSNGDTGDDAGVGPDRGSTYSTPRWVKVFGIIALVVILLFVSLLFTRGPHHGPRDHTGIIALVVILLFVILLFGSLWSTRGSHRGPADHTPSGGSAGQTPPSSVIEDHAPPEGGHG